MTQNCSTNGWLRAVNVLSVTACGNYLEVVRLNAIVYPGGVCLPITNLLYAALSFVFSVRILRGCNLNQLVPSGASMQALSLRFCMSIANNQSASLFEMNKTVESSKELTSTAEAVPEVLATLGGGDNVRSMANPYPDPEMQKVLSRKYRISEITWNDTDAKGAVLASLDIMDLLVNVPNISDKLTQFRWLASDVDLEIRMNATPFHIGSVLVSYLPRVITTAAPFSLYTAKTNNLGQLSQAKATLLSASTTNNATLTVKRQGATLFDNIDAANVYAGALGHLIITVLNPVVLATDGSVNPITITVFASFRDPHPAGFGYFPIVPGPVRPQSDEVSFESKAKAVGSILAPEAKRLYDSVIKTGPIGDVMNLVSSATSAAEQFLPLLGLSKPANQATPQPAIVDDFRDVNYSHGVSQATKFAAHPNSGLAAAPLEYMHKNQISDVIRKPTLLLTTIFDKTEPVGNPFLKFPVHPSLSFYDDVSQTFTPSHLAYVSNCFRWWRGGMKMRLHFVTSQFVSARVRITHWPGESLPGTIEDYAGDAVSEIVDIRGETVHDFVVPYTSPFPYQACRGYMHAVDASGWGEMPQEELNSFISVSLVNPLQQPDYDGNAVIYCNVFISAAEDFTFGGLVFPLQRDVVATAPAAKPVPQSLEVDFTKPFKPLVSANAVHEQGVVLPEQFTTIESLLLKYNLTSVSNLGALYLPVTDFDLTNNAIANYHEDGIEFFRKIFRWHRGSLRFKIAPTPPNATEIAADPNRRFTNLLASTMELNTVNGGPSWTAVSDGNTRAVVEFELPWMYNSYVCTNWAFGCPIDDFANYMLYEVVLYSGGMTGVVSSIWRSVGDDFVFGHLLPTPFLVAPWVPPPPQVRPFVQKAKQNALPNDKGKEKPVVAPPLDQSVGAPLTKAQILERLGIYSSKK